MKNGKSKNKLILACLATLSLFGCNVKHVPEIADVQSFSFSLGGGMMRYYGYDYAAVINDAVVTVTIRPMNVPEEESVTIETDSSFMTKIKEIIAKYDVNQWNEFAGNNKNALDGDSFGLRVEMSNGETISAHGYVKWPKNYTDVKIAFEELFNGLYKKNAE